MHQPLDTRLDLHKGTVFSDISDLAEEARALGITACNAIPWIVTQLLDAERHTILVLIEAQDLGRDFLTNGEHLGGVTHAAPGHVGNVQKPIDTAEVDECAVVGNVLHDPGYRGAFLEVIQEFGPLFAHAVFNHGAARQDDVVALAIKLDNFEL